jgi:hypothetical protein
MTSGGSPPGIPLIATLVRPITVGPLIVGVTRFLEHLPVESSNNGGVFTDRFDDTLFWWLADYQLAASPDAAFGFAASVQGIDDDSGLPLYSAQLTFGMVAVEPAGLAAARTAQPAAAFQPIPPLSLDVALTVIGKTETGADDPRTYPAVLTPGSDGAFTATVTLIGPAVTVAYDSLAHGTTATLGVQCSYSVWRAWSPWRFRPLISVMHPVINPLVIAGSGTKDSDTLDPEVGDLPITTSVRVNPILVRRFPPVIGPVNPPEPDDTTWVTGTDQAATTIAIGPAYGADGYRSHYTVATSTETDATVRPIIDASDLTGFATARSEFVELTSLGSVADRYPSIRRLYFGLASGRVVIVPQSYCIQRGSKGLAATLHATVDDTPGPHSSGARFDFTFTLAPAIDPIEYAQLTHDLAAIPEATNRTLTLMYADGLDSRSPATFSGFPAATSTVVDGSQPSTLNLQVTIVDTDQSPALSLVNLFLDQLGSTVSPMAGTVAVRLDDAYATPVTTALTVELAQTAAGDELAFTAGDATTVTVQNLSPLSLQLTGAASVAPDGATLFDVDLPLAANAIVAITVTDSTLPLVVRDTLALGTPSRPSGVLSFLEILIETTQSIRHVITYNATGAFTGTVTQIDLSASLAGAPDVTISPLTLTANHSFDSVYFTLPLVTALTDLTCTIALVVTDGGPARYAMLSHDFSGDPIMVITADDLAAAVPNT